MTERVRVLVIDDSAVARQALSELLTRAGMEVSVAADPIFALAKIRRSRPDVIVLDLEMPRMDGLTFLSHVAEHDPIPVVVCSVAIGRGSDAAIAALERGAVDVVGKPRLGVRDFLHETGDAIAATVRAAAASRPRPSLERPGAADFSRPAAPRTGWRARLIAVGASTGGTDALLRVLAPMPPEAPGFVVVQHMPAGFTAAFARRLDQLCAMTVREAARGDRVEPGVILIAPGSHHLVVRAGPAGQLLVDLDAGPPVSWHRPSVDVLFNSVARVAGATAIGVILTGMGADGADGLAAMRAAGATTLAQDEASSVVFGMPKAAIQRGAVDHVVGLDALATTLLEEATGR